MKVKRIVMEDDFCTKCLKVTLHKFTELADGPRIVECFLCGDMIINTADALAVNQ